MKQLQRGKKLYRSFNLLSKWINKHVKCSVPHCSLAGIKADKKEK